MLRNYFKHVCSFILIISACSCSINKEKTYTIAISSVNTSLHQAGKPLAMLLEKELGLKIELITNTTGSYEDINLLLTGEADFAIAQNTIDLNRLMESNVKVATILPIYEQILIIVSEQNKDFGSLDELIPNSRIGMGERNGGTASLVQDIFAFYGYDTNLYEPVYHPYGDNYLEKSEIVCSITAFNQPYIQKLSQNKQVKFVGLDDVVNLGKGSSVEALCKNIWTLKPYILPKRTYGNKPDMPVLTVASDAVLLCKTDLEEKLVQKIARCIVEHKTELIQETPIFSALSEDFDQDRFTFPLHKGTKDFINRDVPTFLERYAEVSSLIFSILVVVIGAFASFAKWSRQKKKDRIDVYYKKNLEYRSESDKIDTIKGLNTLKYNLELLRRDAISNLIEEKLSADESFSIFIEMNQQALIYIDQKIKNL